MTELPGSFFCGGLRVSVLLVALMVVSPSAIAQSPEDIARMAAVAQIRATLSQRSLWGRDYPLLIASIPGWARIGERAITVAPDVIFGNTAYLTREDADADANTLAAALKGQQATLTPAFASIARQASSVMAGKVGVRPYNNGESYRVILGSGLNFLPVLDIAEVQQTLGQEQDLRREVDDRGNRRPLVFTIYVYAGGTELFQTSNYAPSPDQVVRVVLDTELSLRAIRGPQ